MQECTLHVEGCKPVFKPGVCCPVRYECGNFFTLLNSRNPALNQNLLPTLKIEGAATKIIRVNKIAYPYPAYPVLLLFRLRQRKY